MGRAAGAGNHDAEAALGCPAREVGGGVGGAVSGKDMGFIRDAEAVESLDAMAHRFPIGGAAHDDSDERGFLVRHDCPFPRSAIFASGKPIRLRSGRALRYFWPWRNAVARLCSSDSWEAGNLPRAGFWSGKPGGGASIPMK